MIRTGRLLLRPFRQDDLLPLHAMFSDPRAMRYWDRPAWDDVERTRALLAAFMQDAPDRHLEYAVEREGAMIGRVGMWRLHEIGYIFRPDQWRQGIATEAVAALVDAIPARFPEARVLTAECDPRNLGSTRLLERVGFTKLREEKQNFDYGGLELCDTAYYERRLDQGAIR